jgi:hypothetical protein
MFENILLIIACIYIGNIIADSVDRWNRREDI